MRKLLFSASFIILFLFFTSEALASSLVTVGQGGVVVVNVLAKETSSLEVATKSDIEIKDVANSGESGDLISLAKSGEEVNLKVGNSKSFNVTDWQENLIEIEERDNAKKVTVSLKDGKFIISQEGFIASTDFPLEIDPVKNHFIVATSSGEKYLAVLPHDAAQTALRAKALSSVNPENLTIIEEGKDVGYALLGEKSVNLFNVYTLTIPVEAKVSASTGEVISTNEPVWLKLLSFFLS